MPFYNGKEYKPNKDGLFRTTITVTDFQGKKRRPEITSKDFNTFVEKLKKFEYEMQNGIAIVNGNSTVEKWAYEWVETYKTDITEK